jgi:hypothetical protein
MDSAIEYFLEFQTAYFGAILSPFKYGLATFIPAIGFLCLVAGVGVGLATRRRDFLLFLTLPIVSQAFVIISELMRGALQSPALEPVGSTIVLAFLLLQVAVAGYLACRARGARLAASALAIFTVSYAFYAAFFAGMALANDGL